MLFGLLLWTLKVNRQVEVLPNNEFLLKLDVIPFGLCNAPALFEIIMYTILKYKVTKMLKLDDLFYLEIRLKPIESIHYSREFRLQILNSAYKIENFVIQM